MTIKASSEAAMAETTASKVGESFLSAKDGALYDALLRFQASKVGESFLSAKGRKLVFLP